MKFIPWRRVKDWECLVCGECCSLFSVPLRMHEFARILRAFGPEVLEIRLGAAHLRRIEGRCVFLQKRGDMWLCGLQSMKPTACKLWPFRPLQRPRHGRAEEAHFEHAGEEFYVYLDPRCPGIALGTPSEHLVKKVIPEVIELRMGKTKGQRYTTSNLPQLSEVPARLLSATLQHV